MLPILKKIKKLEKDKTIDLPGLHHVLCQGGMGELLLRVQEGVPVEQNVGVVNAHPAKGVSDPLAGHDGRH